MTKGTKTGGRRAGTPNRISGTVRENVIAVFDAIGGTEAMERWARENQSEFYRFYSKLLPTEIRTEFQSGMSLIEILSSMPIHESSLIEESEVALAPSTQSTLEAPSRA